MTAGPHLLYLAPWLPKLSETFVYRELLALRALGLQVSAASIHPPEQGLGDPALDQLAGEALCLYRGGPAAVLRAALGEALRHPARAAATLALALRDSFRAGDARGRARLKIAWHALAGLALARAARRQGVTHIHAHFAHVSASIAMYAARQLGGHFSFTGHAADLFRDRALLPEKLRRAAFVACISHWHRAFYQSLVARPEAEYPIVRCGVDPAEFVPGPPPAAGAPLRILAVGRLVPKKGFDVLIAALATVQADGLRFHARILGDGPEHAALAEQVAKAGLNAQVELAGAAPNREVREALRAADLFVLPCRVDAAGDRDGIPVVLMEAMACEVCAISGDLPAIRELIASGDCGILVPPGDAGALAAEIGRLARQPDDRRKLAAAGRARVGQEFALDLNARRLHNAFSMIAKEP